MRIKTCETQYYIRFELETILFWKNTIVLKSVYLILLKSINIIIIYIFVVEV